MLPNKWTTGIKTNDIVESKIKQWNYYNIYSTYYSKSEENTFDVFSSL